MDLQPPANLPMHDDVSSGATPPVPPPPSPFPPSSPIPPPPAAAPMSASALGGALDDMFSTVEPAPSAPSPIPPPPVAAVPVQAMPERASAPAPTIPPAAAPSRVLSPLPESSHPPVLHYVLIALGVVVVLGIIAGTVWFFAIRRPTQQVIEALPAVPEAPLANDAAATPDPLETDTLAPADEPFVSDNVFSEAEMIPPEPVVTPPEGTNIPPPTSIDPDGTQQPALTEASTGSASSTELAGTGGAEGETMADLDSDGDGLSDAREIELGTNAQNRDTDGDGLTDGEEVLTYRTNPLIPDTDGDGYPDGVEVRGGYNPLGSGSCANPTCTF